MSPTQRTLKALKDMGRTCGIVERFIAQAGPFGQRRDLFGIIDIIALDPERGVVGVQSTGQDFSGHWKKITEEMSENTRLWLETPGASLELWAWRKVKKVRGGKAMIWKPRIASIVLDDLQITGR